MCQQLSLIKRLTKKSLIFSVSKFYPLLYRKPDPRSTRSETIKEKEKQEEGDADNDDFNIYIYMINN